VHRFFLPKSSIGETEVIFPEDNARQIFRVLRLRSGEHVVVLDNCGYEYDVILDYLDGKVARGTIISKMKSGNESSISISLYICLTQRDKFEWILQKCTEIGVATFIPVISSRSLVQTRDDWENKKNRYQKIIQEAAEQSNRGKIPQIFDLVSLERIKSEDLNGMPALIFWEGEKNRSLQKELRYLQTTEPSLSRISLLVGPEGGFSEQEVEKASSTGFTPVTLGRRILRMETAAAVSAALVLYEFGEMQ